MKSISMVRTLDAPIEAVWRAWVDPSEFGTWFWPERFNTVASVSAETGGLWRVSSKPMSMAASGIYLQVERLRLLRFTWKWDNETTESVVTVTFGPEETTSDGGVSTTLTVEHEGYLTDEVGDELEQGWNDCLDRLPGWLKANA